MWKPNINRHTVHKVQTLVNFLKRDICSGHLIAGERLPTQNELVEYTGIAKSTIAKAYQEANAAGLINTIVGKGSFVAGKGDPFLQAVDNASDELLDLRIDYPLYALDPILSDTLAQIAKDDSQHLLKYQDHAGHQKFREAGLNWLQLNGVKCSLDQVVLTGGAQHALTVCLSSVTEAGQTILVEELTYPGIRETADMLGLTLVPVPMDENGVIPEALENALYENEKVKVFYTSPTVQNPTTTLTPDFRRVEIAKICQKHGIFIIEDDIHRLFSDDQPNPYANLLPELTFFIASFSKVVCGGLRVAYVCAPKETIKMLRRRLLATYWTLPPLMAEIATRWINDGTALVTLHAKKEEASSRQKLARRILGKKYIKREVTCLYTWVDLPKEWTAETFISEALKNGVAVLGDGTFCVTPNSSRTGVRLSLGAAPSQLKLATGLNKLALMLKDGPSCAIGVI